MSLRHGRHEEIVIDVDYPVSDVEIVIVESHGGYHCGGEEVDIVVHAIENSHDGATVTIAADIHSESVDISYRLVPDINPVKQQIARHLNGGK